MVVTGAATVAAFALGVIIFWGAAVPLALGTIEWALNIGNMRRRP